jgi:twitching motility protein PilT
LAEAGKECALAPPETMVLIDKLLQVVVTQQASDLHLYAGHRPMLRIRGRTRRLETPVLEREDTLRLMRSITPDDCQQQLAQWGTCDFNFAFGDRATFDVSIIQDDGNVGIYIRPVFGASERN